MAKLPIPESIRDLPQPVLPGLIKPRAIQIQALAETVQTLCADVLPDGALTPLGAHSIGHCLATLRRELDAISETMRLKIQSLDCAQAIARYLGRAGKTEAALYRQLNRRGFSAADMQAAITAMIERGQLLRLPDPDRTTTKGPKPHRIYWRQLKEATA